MQKIKRETFLKMGAFTLMTPLFNGFLMQQLFAKDKKHFFDGSDLHKRFIEANDRQVTGLLESINTINQNFSRKIGYDFNALASAYVSPDSIYFHSNLIVPRLEILTGVLMQFQTADGTVNIANLESPPDTAFLVELLTGGAGILIKDNALELAEVNKNIKTFLIKAGNALIIGGVHTPNHRWVISAALARLHALYPNPKYVKRIEEWLSEGLFIDKDGHYPERSSIYSVVENTAFVAMGRLLNKPSLFSAVRKNLEMSWYYMEPNGDMVTTDSRRQDQYLLKTIVPYYFLYRYMAIQDRNAHFAAICTLIESMPGFEKEVLEKGLFHLLEDSFLQNELPASSTLPVTYEKFFETSKLLRIRRGKLSATFFGGVDWPLVIASGQSNSPNFFSYRNGNAILKYMRLSSGFFSMGYFYSDGLKKEGNKYILHKKLEIPYYQPLPREKQKKNGDYALTPSIDKRFWNKMDFSNRPVSNVKTMDTTISFVETSSGIELDFLITGMVGIPITIELCFLEGGKLTGVTDAGNGNSFLENGIGKYEFGGDTILFGSGVVTHKNITALEGENYSTHFGSLRTDGMHVFITGTTPFNHKLTFS